MTSSGADYPSSLKITAGDKDCNAKERRTDFVLQYLYVSAFLNIYSELGYHERKNRARAELDTLKKIVARLRHRAIFDSILGRLIRPDRPIGSVRSVGPAPHIRERIPPLHGSMSIKAGRHRFAAMSKRNKA